jgi:penicillin amidase
VANQSMTNGTPDVELGAEYDPGWRSDRIAAILQEKDRLTLRDIAEMQMDTGSEFARTLAPWFGRLEPQDSYEKVAAGLLRKWDYRLGADSSAATVFQYAWRTLLMLTYGDKLGDALQQYMGASVAPLFAERGYSQRSAVALSRLIDSQIESFWYSESATGRDRDRHEVLSEALSQAVKQLRNDLGDNARRWEWGRLHQVRFNHGLAGSRLMRTYFNRGPFPVGGDSTTPMQTGTLPTLPTTVVQVLPTYRQIVDTSDWDTAQSCLTTGQSGHPLSDNYADQIDIWREGAYHAMPWSRMAVDELAVHRMFLRPTAA